MNNYNQKYKRAFPFNKGFTLVEIMVATSIFMIIMLIAIGALVVGSDAARRAERMRFAIDNVNFAIENISRSIRMGTNYTCVTTGSIPMTSSPATQDCTSGGNFVAFIPWRSTPDPSVRVGYKVEQRTSGPFRADGVTHTYTLKRCIYDSAVSPAVICADIVSPDIDIQTLKFFVKGSDASDNIQPSIYIIVKGAVNIKGTWSSFALQTMASQRSSE